MSDLLNMLPSVVEDIIYDYKLDLDIVSETKKKYNYLILEFNEVIVETTMIYNIYIKSEPNQKINFSFCLLSTIHD
jgi:hypothetical protein